MAIFRFLLALSICFIHLQWFFPEVLTNYTILPGLVAVQSFFIISGFYMSMIITEKYSQAKHPYFLYISNRFLRIFPIYWFVLIVIFLFQIITTGGFIHFLHSLQMQGVENISFTTLQVIKNITIVISPDGFIWTKNWYGGLLLFQAWTLVVELTFYLIAPFIVKRSLKLLLTLLVFSFLIRTLIWHSHMYPMFNSDYFFLPNFIFFILGILAYRLQSLLPYASVPKRINTTLILGFILFTFLYLFLPEYHHIKEWLYYLSLTGLIPILFAFNSSLNISILGDLAYPIYIGHYFIILVFAQLRVKSIFLDLFFIILFALFMHYFIAKPIDKIRLYRVKKNISEDVE